MPTTKPLRVVLAEGKEDVRRLLHLHLRDEQSIRIVGVAGDSKALLGMVNAETPDAAIVDLYLPGMGGFEAACRIRELSPRTYIVMLTGVSWPHLEAQALAHGANALVELKSLPRLLEMLRGRSSFLTQEFDVPPGPSAARQAFRRVALPM